MVANEGTTNPAGSRSPAGSLLALSALQDPRYRALIERMVEARKASGQTQRDIAAKLRRPPSYVGKYETCERRLDVIEFIDVLVAIGVDPQAFFLTIETSPRSPARRKRL